MRTDQKFDENDFSKSWLKFRRAPAGSDIWLENEWVVDASIFWSQERPETLWKGIKQIFKCGHDLNDHEISMLGSGPIEALLSEHFDDFFARVIEAAKSNRDLHRALSSAQIEEYDKPIWEAMFSEWRR